MTDNSTKRILIIDDAALVRTYYRAALEARGFEVEEALNGLEGLEKLLLELFDFVIVDINMPQMDGITFLRMLRSKELPVSRSRSGDEHRGRTTRYGGRAKRGGELLSCEANQAGNAGGIRRNLLRVAADERVPRAIPH